MYSKLATSEHKYLVNKQVNLPNLGNSNAYLGLQYMDIMQGLYKALIIPIYGIKEEFEGKVQSLQIIAPDGKKRFYQNSSTKGGYYPVNIPNGFNEIVICEGIATGITLAEHYTPSALVICAFNAGNLMPVAKYFRNQYTSIKITIAGDNDHLNDINIGKQKAEEAAQTIGASVSLPDFKAGQQGSDFNDYYILNKSSEVVL